MAVAGLRIPLTIGVGGGGQTHSSTNQGWPAKLTAMKMVNLPVLLASTLAALCLATIARAQDVIRDVFVASGIRYRVSAVSSPQFGMSLQAVPEVPLAAPNSAHTLPLDEQLSRCDEFVARALEARGLAGSGDARLVRDRVEPRPGNRSWVLYAQRHQGYRILGAGGRLLRRRPFRRS